MADTKISALPASTTPLAGTEALPVVQGGVTRQTSVANLTAGRAISVAELTLSTGNLAIGTSGKGIDFSADGSAAGMTSELLDDYEEGTWTPVIRGSSTAGTYEQQTTFASYTKVGRLVTVQAYIKLAAAITGGGTGLFQITGLPFAKGANTSWGAGTVFTSNFDYGGVSLAVTFATSSSGSGLVMIGSNDNAGWSYSQISGAAANDEFSFTISYEV